ncbi:MAG: hypothetical protein JSU77_06730 [Fidelibacterota bacterium]|nr:MAG: hypothetical protein JSU77_06730 [Candidatus Neomarinimicrobiota bacterium]
MVNNNKEPNPAQIGIRLFISEGNSQAVNPPYPHYTSNVLKPTMGFYAS